VFDEIHGSQDEGSADEHPVTEGLAAEKDGEHGCPDRLRGHDDGRAFWGQPRLRPRLSEHRDDSGHEGQVQHGHDVRTAGWKLDAAGQRAQQADHGGGP
jgi:hypothetical protein